MAFKDDFWRLLEAELLKRATAREDAELLKSMDQRTAGFASWPSTTADGSSIFQGAPQMDVWAALLNKSLRQAGAPRAIIHPDGLDAKDTNPKTVYGQAKPPIGLLPSAALIETAMVFQDGQDKYGKANWREDPVSVSTYTNALLRHLLKYLDGHDRDPESARKELAHVAANAMILLDAEACGTLIDDRGPKGPAAEVLKACTKEILPHGD